MSQTFRLSALSVVIAGTLAVPSAFASGYHFGSQSVSVQSTSNASSAEAATPGTIFYNPAGLSKLPGTQLSANLITVVPRVKYKNANGKYFRSSLDPRPAAPIQGASSGDIAPSVLFVPHLYASYQLNPQWTAGLGIYVPFGAGIEYEDNSIMRYSVKETELETINIHPSIAYDFQNGHSVAAGVIAQYTKAGLGKDVDFAPALGAQIGKPIPSGAADVDVDVSGDGWGFGYNLGWMWDINDSARVGVSYRSKIKHTLKGTANWNIVGPAFKDPTIIETGNGPAPVGVALSQGVRGAGYKAEEGASVELITPESLSLHGMIKVNPQLDLFGDVTWTRHSRFNELNVEYENKKHTPDATGKSKRGAIVDTTRFTPNWRDTYKVSLGAAYQLNDRWQLRGGVGYDQSPVRNVETRLPTMPDNDRLLLSIGSKYDIDKNQSLDFAYTLIHVKDASADSAGYCGGMAKDGPGAINCVSDRTRASADYKSNAHFFGLQYTYRF